MSVVRIPRGPNKDSTPDANAPATLHLRLFRFQHYTGSLQQLTQLHTVVAHRVQSSVDLLKPQFAYLFIKPGR